MATYLWVILTSTLTLTASDHTTPQNPHSHYDTVTSREKSAAVYTKLIARQNNRMALLLQILNNDLQMCLNALEENDKLIKKSEEALNTTEKEKSRHEKVKQ